MKLNPDKVRQVLMDVETRDTNVFYKGDDPEWGYAALKLAQAGYLDSRGKPQFQVNRGSVSQYPIAMAISGLTFEGHDLLNSIRDDTVWAKVKGEVIPKAGGWTLDLLGEFAKGVIRQQAKKFGLDL